MPKKSSYLLAWSPAQQAYVLSESSGTARLGIEQAGILTLTLVSAPAGFGKTTLLAQWLAERRRCW